MRKPSYLSRNLKEIKEKVLSLLAECRICPRECGVNRLRNEKGHCQTGRYAVVSSYGPHFGEEPELVGNSGSGTIFFSYCNLNCLYCQNYEISQLGEGRERDEEALAKIMLYLQEIGCHNINLVSPTHIVPQFLEALELAVKEGLKIPIVYNSGGYDKVETLKLLEGIIDIYMPDAKYADDENSKKYSNAPNYFAINKLALKEMHRQVGDLICDERGIAQRGLIIRHLVLPNRIAGSFRVLEFIAREISKDTYVNIMAQYRPCYHACRYLELSRRITDEEFKEVIEYAKSLGLHRGF
ncbi:MAG: radical SAM protein [candidate division WOR-3 bacterium]